MASFKVLSFILWLCFCATAYANTINKRQDTMIQMNRYSALENAYSHGSMGFDLGIGGHVFTMQDTQSLSSTNAPVAHSKNMFLPKIYITKGLNVPIDFGLSLGHFQSASGAPTSIQYGGHAQWTFFQEVKYPALALRASFNRTQLEVGDVSSTEFAFIAGQGLMTYFNVYGGMTLGMHETVFREPPQQADYGLLDPDYNRIVKQKTNAGFILGAGVLALPPFLSVDLETQSSFAGQDQSYSAKVSLGL